MLTAFLFAVAFISPALSNQHMLVYRDVPRRLVYSTYANQGQTNSVNTVADFSRGGYRGGGVPIPFIPAVVTLNDGGPGGDTDRIQNAIGTVANMPLGVDGFRGAVLLMAGEYEVSEQLNINDDGIVLRGAGSQAVGGTRIIFTSTAPAGEPATLIRVDGAIILSFENCNSGTIEYDIPSINRQGLIPILRVANDNVVPCEALNSLEQGSE